MSSFCTQGSSHFRKLCTWLGDVRNRDVADEIDRHSMMSILRHFEFFVSHSRVIHYLLKVSKGRQLQLIDTLYTTVPFPFPLQEAEL